MGNKCGGSLPEQHRGKDDRINLEIKLALWRGDSRARCYRNRWGIKRKEGRQSSGEEEKETICCLFIVYSFCSFNSDYSFL